MDFTMQGNALQCTLLDLCI